LEVIAGLQQKGVMAVAKHFPGIGRTVADSHLDLPVLETDLECLNASDLVPFREAIERGVDGVMLSHIVYRCLDSKWPASLSERIARELLRRRLGFDGIVMTDDLDMGAIAKHFDIQTAVEQVLLADVDIALICHSREKMAAAFEHLKTQLESSATLRASARAAYDRILAIKTKYTLKR
jgi:beta-N-acetylhexosaminidase